MARSDEDVAAREVAAFELRQVDRDALPRFRLLHGGVVHLHRPHAHGATGRLDTQLVPCGDRASPERSGRDGADAAKREDAVDVQPRRTAGIAFGDRQARERRAQLVEAGAGLRRNCDHLGARHQLVRLLRCELECLVVDGVRLRQRDDAVLDAEQLQHGEVLARLRPRALLRVDHEQEQVDACRSGDHRAHEAFVSRHVDE